MFKYRFLKAPSEVVSHTFEEGWPPNQNAVSLPIPWYALLMLVAMDSLQFWMFNSRSRHTRREWQTNLNHEEATLFSLDPVISLHFYKPLKSRYNCPEQKLWLSLICLVRESLIYIKKMLSNHIATEVKFVSCRVVIFKVMIYSHQLLFCNGILKTPEMKFCFLVTLFFNATGGAGLV